MKTLMYILTFSLRITNIGLYYIGQLLIGISLLFL